MLMNKNVNNDVNKDSPIEITLIKSWPDDRLNSKFNITTLSKQSTCCLLSVGYFSAM